MQVGDRVYIKSVAHPMYGRAGEIIALNEKYDLGWRTGHRVRLDGNDGETYATESELFWEPQKSSNRKR